MATAAVMPPSSSSIVDPMTPSTAAMPRESRPFRPFLSKLRSSFGYSSAAEQSSSSSSSSEGELSDSEDASTTTSSAAAAALRELPQCWGHRGASAAFPENTLASFEQAIRDGAEGIESDVHVSLDGTIVMFHDAYLNRTTNGKGLISKQAYKGGIDALRTTKLPAQRICTFAETLALLMRPDARHVVLNVDVKLDNDPEVLYTLMHEQIAQFPEWETQLAPRLVLGLWHAKYIEPAQRLLPYCRLAHIGVSPAVARKYFWSACTAFSLNFATLVGREGQGFVRACRREGKDLYVWTVNDRAEMIQATKWGAKAILTDRTADFLSLRGQMSNDWDKVAREVDWSHAWRNLYYFSPVNMIYMAWENFLMERTAGPMALPTKATTSGRIKVSSSDTSVQ